MHYYQFNIADYRKDTMHLTPQEHYIYRSLIDTYYLTEKPLSLDVKSIMRLHCLKYPDDAESMINVLSDFFVKLDTGFHHKRIDAEIADFHSKSSKASESAKARWNKESCERNANAMRTQCDGNANHKPITNNHIYIPKVKQTIPEKFTISDNVKKWAESKSLYNLEHHLEHFINSCKANNYKYLDWDRAFMNAITGNWAKIENKKKGGLVL